MCSLTQREGKRECENYGWIMPSFITSQCGLSGEKKIHKLHVKRTVSIPIKAPSSIYWVTKHRSRVGL